MLVECYSVDCLDGELKDNYTSKIIFVAQVLSLPTKVQWMTDSPRRALGANTFVAMHVIELYGTGRPALLVEV